MLSPLVMLGLVAVLEAVVWLWRLRSGVGASRWQSAASTVGVCATRMLWLAAGVQATLKEEWVVGTVVYCGAAVAMERTVEALREGRSGLCLSAGTKGGR